MYTFLAYAGAVQFLFRLPDGARYVHCGDMRFCRGLLDNEHLRRFVGADAVYLDTTYCKLKHQFPPQVQHHISCCRHRTTNPFIAAHANFSLKPPAPQCFMYHY